MWRKWLTKQTYYEANFRNNGGKLGMASWWNGRHKGLKRRFNLLTHP